MKHYLGIDLGGTNIVAGIVDAEGHILSKTTCKTRAPRPAQAIADDMAAVARQAVADAGLALGDLEWAGIGCPGCVDRDSGVIVHAANLAFYGVPLLELMQDRLGLRVLLENDANAAAFGELVAGAGREQHPRSMVAITLGTGVGSGIVLDGKLFSGSNHAGGEMGHMVIEKDGRPCTCGRRGCFEAYASATGLIIMTQEAMRADPGSAMWELCGGDLEQVSGRTAFDAMRRGDRTGSTVVEEYLGYLACGVINVINIFQPELVCIGGGISKEGETLLAPIRARIAQEDFARFSPKRTKVVIAQLGSDAGLIGAALLGLSV